MNVVLQHIETGEKFILLNHHIFKSLKSGSFDYVSYNGSVNFNSYINEYFTVIDIDGNVFDLYDLDKNKNKEYFHMESMLELGYEMDDIDNSQNIEYISYREIQNYRVIEIDGKPISELLK